MKISPSLCALAAAVLIPEAWSAVVPNPLFSDHAVLQESSELPVWGTAADGEHVIVAIAGQKAATAAKDGRWMVRLHAVPTGGPYTMTISGDRNTVTVSDLLVGEVWVCSGQSNMERQLGLREGQKPIINWEQEAAAANYPQIRQFFVPQKTALSPVTSVDGKWVVCSPQTVAGFTAVGYFFGRDLFQARQVPVGLIHSSWGGTPAEAWTSQDALRKLPDFAGPVAELEQFAAALKAGTFNYDRLLASWYTANDVGMTQKQNWSAPELDTSAWKQMDLPVYWEKAGLPDFDGIVWFRRAFELPTAWTGGDVELHLGAVDDDDTTWVNGVQVGATIGYDIPRVYRVPSAALKPGTNVIAVRVLDTGGNGGIWGGGKDTMRLVSSKSADPAQIDLTGSWQWKVSASLSEVPHPPADYRNSPAGPGVLYNGMIAPLLPYSIRGVIWYQGESNVGREKQYRTLFPAMIADWRRVWGEGNFPFLFVQIAPFKDNTPEIREAQLLTWEHTPNTAMAVTIDCGDAADIHPAHKQPMGARLALAARALAYGEALEYSGPVFKSMKPAGSQAVLSFTHLGGGLVAKDGSLTGFTIAGPDKVFHPAVAQIKDNTVVVSSLEVPHPVAVRYGWANVPEGNFFNAAGLPASPFRTDVD
jgi:sialate O-acetylesterase